MHVSICIFTVCTPLPQDVSEFIIYMCVCISVLHHCQVVAFEAWHAHTQILIYANVHTCKDIHIYIYIYIYIHTYMYKCCTTARSWPPSGSGCVAFCCSGVCCSVLQLKENRVHEMQFSHNSRLAQAALLMYLRLFCWSLLLATFDVCRSLLLVSFVVCTGCEPLKTLVLHKLRRISFDGCRALFKVFLLVSFDVCRALL